MRRWLRANVQFVATKKGMVAALALVAAGSSEISAHIGGVTTAAAATGTAAGDVLSNARELDTQSGMLRSAVDEFLQKVRAA